MNDQYPADLVEKLKAEKDSCEKVNLLIKYGFHKDAVSEHMKTCNGCAWCD